MTARSLIRIAHRGGGSLAPENSIQGIERSLEYGVDMIEVDVRRTRDGVLALSHDAVAHGTTEPVATSTFEELRAASPDIATVDEALEAAGRRARINLDIKSPELAADTVEAVRRHGALDWCIVSCLHFECLGEVAQMEPALPRFWSYPPDYGGASQRPWLKPVVNAVVAGMRMTMTRRLERTLRPLPGTSATIYAPLITRRLVDLAHRRGMQLFTWTVDDLAEMRRLAALGVDGITSNRPDLLAQLAGAPAAVAD